MEWIPSIVTGLESSWIELRPGFLDIEELYNKAEVHSIKLLKVTLRMLEYFLTTPR